MFIVFTHGLITANTVPKYTFQPTMRKGDWDILDQSVKPTNQYRDQTWFFMY